MKTEIKLLTPYIHDCQNLWHSLSAAVQTARKKQKNIVYLSTKQNVNKAHVK